MDRHQKFARSDLRDLLLGERDFAVVDDVWQELASNDEILEKMGDSAFAARVSQAAALFAGLLCEGRPSWSPKLLPFPVFGDGEIDRTMEAFVKKLLARKP